jgi:hypothetical protein
MANVRLLWERAGLYGVDEIFCGAGVVWIADE